MMDYLQILISFDDSAASCLPLLPTGSSNMPISFCLQNDLQRLHELFECQVDGRSRECLIIFRKAFPKGHCDATI